MKKKRQPSVFKPVAADLIRFARLLSQSVGLNPQTVTKKYYAEGGVSEDAAAKALNKFVARQDRNIALANDPAFWAETRCAWFQIARQFCQRVGLSAYNYLVDPRNGIDYLTTGPGAKVLGTGSSGSKPELKINAFFDGCCGQDPDLCWSLFSDKFRAQLAHEMLSPFDLVDTNGHPLNGNLRVSPSHDGFSTRAICATLHGHFAESSPDYPDKICVVPKNAEIGRCIGISSPFLYTVQHQIENALLYALKVCYHVDLDRLAAVNSTLAYHGSIDGSFATLDFQEASDSLSIPLIRSLFEGSPLLPYLEAARSTRYRLPDGTVGTSGSFCLMGNGYTFKLESVVFMALACGATADVTHFDVEGPYCPALSFGDDLTLPEPVPLQSLKAVFGRVGLTLNAEKSFCMQTDPDPNNRFREACGRDFRNGKPVRGFYFKREPDLSEAYRLVNFFKIHYGVPDSLLKRLSKDCNRVYESILAANPKCWQTMPSLRTATPFGELNDYLHSVSIPEDVVLVDPIFCQCSELIPVELAETLYDYTRVRLNGRYVYTDSVGKCTSKFRRTSVRHRDCLGNLIENVELCYCDVVTASEHLVRTSMHDKSIKTNLHMLQERRANSPYYWDTRRKAGVLEFRRVNRMGNNFMLGSLEGTRCITREDLTFASEHCARFLTKTKAERIFALLLCHIRESNEVTFTMN